MRGTLDQSEFQDAVLLVQGIAQSKISNPVVENVVLRFEKERAEILATNLSISIRVRLGIDSAEPGEIALPAKLLGQVVREIPHGKVDLTLEGSEFQISAGRANFRLHSVDTEDFPPFLPEVEGPVVEIPAEMAAQAIKRTVFATSEERARFQLGGIKFSHTKGEAVWVATDGRRLSRIKHVLDNPPAEDCSMLVPARAAQELLRALPGEGNLYMTVGDKRVLFDCENVTIASTLLEDNFPPYEGLLPSDYTIEVRADRDLLNAAVRRASILASEKTRLVHLETRDGELIVTGERQEAGDAHDELDAVVTGDPVKVSYNASFLLECLAAVGPGQVVWGLVQQGGAGYFSREDDDTFLHIIMPMTVK
ncbi:MAG: DNA polymerase III subunit beta, partial [Candidatus Omnitrophica bacterium]|nr:DNA polymerase III subunit beta [Candidatus Omnitrophota bacterium]